MWGNIRNSASVMRIFRGIRTNAILRDAKPTTGTTSSSKAGQDRILDSHSHCPTEWEKKILVWTNTFPNKEAIPEKIRLDTMQKAMSRGRIRCANFMIVISLAGCAYVIYQGKQHVAEDRKDAEVEHLEMRRQIAAEYRALPKA